MSALRAGDVDNILLGRVRVADERRGLLPHSIAKKQMHLRAFMRWLDDRHIFDVKREDIETFLDARCIGPKTRHCWLSHLRVFYRWAVEEGLTSSDPTERIPSPRIRRNLPRPAPDGDIQKALAGASPRERCWVLLAAFQGLRCQEIGGLRREDVDEREGTLRVTCAKGGTERMLPLHPEVHGALVDLPMPKRGYLFLVKGQPFRPKYLSRVFNEHLEAQGTRITAHQLRHFFGTRLYSQTHDLRLVQEMLGHQNPNTTAVYVKLDPSRGREAVRGLGIEGDVA